MAHVSTSKFTTSKQLKMTTLKTIISTLNEERKTDKENHRSQRISKASLWPAPCVGHPAF